MHVNSSVTANSNSNCMMNLSYFVLSEPPVPFMMSVCTKRAKKEKGVIWSHVHVCKAELLLFLKPGKICSLQALFGLVWSPLCSEHCWWSTCMLALAVSEAQKHGVPFLCHHCMLLIRGASSWACLSKLRNRHVDLFDMFSMDHCCKVRSQYTRQAYSVSHLEMYLKFQTITFHLSVILLLH